MNLGNPLFYYLLLHSGFLGKSNEDRLSFNNYFFVPLIIERFLVKKYNEIFFNFDYFFYVFRIFYGIFLKPNFMFLPHF